MCKIKSSASGTEKKVVRVNQFCLDSNADTDESESFNMKVDVEDNRPFIPIQENNLKLRSYTGETIRPLRFIAARAGGECAGRAPAAAVRGPGRRTAASRPQLDIGGKLFSKIDLVNAHQQVRLGEESQACTAIGKILSGIPGTSVFLDDICITGHDMDEHVDNLRAVLNRLHNAGLRIKLSKAAFREKHGDYACHRNKVEKKASGAGREATPTLNCDPSCPGTSTA
ncbi:Uncharacterized protein K02A2.6 [Eumeta japonica]|uniref:Uncharacterized protein K02A2.6 n=1 Tax=Eumeta variegata TaxID=151549 RepID=A0A4C1ZYJ5_EUMVA|nr:Uncharacterized protein K02A2.6 [Eumeta japonica]